MAFSTRCSSEWEPSAQRKVFTWTTAFSSRGRALPAEHNSNYSLSQKSCDYLQETLRMRPGDSPSQKKGLRTVSHHLRFQSFPPVLPLLPIFTKFQRVKGKERNPNINGVTILHTGGRESLVTCCFVVTHSPVKTHHCASLNNSVSSWFTKLD